MEDCKCKYWARTKPPMFTKHHPSCPKYEKNIIKIWIVAPGEGLAPCTEKDPQAVLVWLEEAEPGEIIKIVVGEIDEAIYNEMPEYMGP